MGLSSGDIFNNKSMNKPKPVAKASASSESSDARTRFTNAKSISSSQFHGTEEDARQTEDTLSRYSVRESPCPLWPQLGLRWRGVRRDGTAWGAVAYPRVARPAGYPSGGVPPAVERQLHIHHTPSRVPQRWGTTSCREAAALTPHAQPGTPAVGYHQLSRGSCTYTTSAHRCSLLSLHRAPRRFRRRTFIRTARRGAARTAAATTTTTGWTSPRGS
jgi:hypothetical protein